MECGRNSIEGMYSEKMQWQLNFRKIVKPKHLEIIRWGDNPECPYCESGHVAPKQVYGKVGRWNCHSCKSSFNVLQGTLFQGTKIPLQKWFIAIFLMGDAKKSLSSCQLARHLDGKFACKFLKKQIVSALIHQLYVLSNVNTP